METDNVFIERLWRSVKYEGIYQWEYATLREVERGLCGWFQRYNDWRPHEALGWATPSAFYLASQGGAGGAGATAQAA